MSVSAHFAIKCLVTAGVGAGALLMLRRIFFKRAKMCPSKTELKGMTVIVTGANTGIGKETAKELANRGAKVILACRNIEKANKAAEDISRTLKKPVNLRIKYLDLASQKSIKTFADEICIEEERVDILINNAGVFGCPYWKTEDGLEMQFGVNHVGHFFLTNLLLEKLKQSLPSRIIVVSSALYKRAEIDFINLNGEKNYDKAYAYSQSKLANLLFVHELSKRLPQGITVNSLHPGVVWTNLGRHLLNNVFKKMLFSILAFLFFKTPTEGAQTSIYLATASELDDISGRYFGDCQMEEVEPKAKSDIVSKKLWDVSEELCGLNKLRRDVYIQEEN